VFPNSSASFDHIGHNPGVARLSFGFRHWLIKDIAVPIVSLLILIGFMLLIFRVAFKGKIGIKK
jgi:hypothetical protein